MTKQTPIFKPDWVSPPGDTIMDLLEEKGLSQTELAQRLGMSEEHLRQLVKGRQPLTDDIARCLAEALGVSANFWRNREARYQKIARPEMGHTVAGD